MPCKPQTAYLYNLAYKNISLSFYIIDVHTPSRLIGTTVHLLISADIQSANHVTAGQYITPCRCRSSASVKINIKHLNGGEV